MNSMKSIRKTLASVVVTASAVLLASTVFAGNPPTPYVMSTGDFFENFSDIANWGDGFTSGIGAAPWSTNAINSSGTIPDGVKITTSSAKFATGSGGGVQKGDNALMFLTTGSTDNTSSLGVDLNLDFTGRNAGTLSFDWAETNNSTGNRAGSIRVYTSTDGTTWTELTDAAVLNVINNVASSGSITAIALPTEFNGSSTARIRFYYYNGTGGTTGSRPKIAIDNLSVTSTGASGAAPVVTGITPTDVTTNAGNTVQFTVTSTGDAPTYFWYKETASATNLIADATTATLTLTNVLAPDTASYQVILTNASGADTSAVVTLTVLDPAINTQPGNETRLVGGSASFSVLASGTDPLSYQWYSKPTSDNFDFTGATALSNGGNISGTDTNTLTITNLAFADATNLFVVVNNSEGSVTSSVVVLTVSATASLAYWNFNGYLDVNHPTVAAGVGTASAVNCVGFSNNISSGLDFDFSSTPNAWGSSTYPAVDVSNKTAGVQFNVSTLGAKNIHVTYDTRASATANEYQRLQYTTNGTDYVDFFASTPFVSANLYESRSFDLTGFPGVDNNTNFAIRIVSEFESTALYGASANDQYVGVSSSYAPSGTLSFDIVNIAADAITNNNTPPTISSFTNVVTTDTSDPLILNFTVGDAETAAGSLGVTAISSNQAVMPDGNMTLGGSGASRTLTLNPNGNSLGVAPILVKVTDGSNDVTATWFYVTVEPGNRPPTISGLDNTNTLGNTTNVYSFVVGDDSTPIASLVTAVSSGNSTLVPNDAAHMFITGSDSNRTVTVIPAKDQYGVAPIFVTVNDGAKESTNAFYLMVRPNAVTLLDEAFDYDTPGAIINQSLGLWSTHSGTAGQMQVGSGVVTITDNNSEDVNASCIGQPYTSGNASALYAKFTLNFTSLPTTTNTYFAHFLRNSTTFYGRIYASTAFTADPNTYYRIGIANGSATGEAQQIPQDLSLGVDYTVVTRLDLTTGVTTMWINPTSENSPGVTNSSSASVPTVAGFALRESPGESTLTIDNLKVAMNFLSAVSNIVDVPPQANPDGYSIVGDTTNNVFSSLTNDLLNLAEGSLSIVSVSPTNGTATISGTNILFSPTKGFAGTTTIGYTITDGFGGLSSSLITVDVSSVAPSPEPIVVQTEAGQIIMSWNQANFSLTSSTNVLGPYKQVSGATSPYTNDMTSGTMFFRLEYP